jgi:exonuclease III
MKLVSWNCNMALGRKWPRLSQFKADIYVIQECSQSDLNHIGSEFGLSDHWIGSNPHKGLGLLVRKPFEVVDFQHTGLTWIGCAKISGPKDLTLYPVWTGIPKADRSLRYIRQIHLLLDRLATNPPVGNVVVVGDFNSNTIWDKEHGDRCHSKAVERLAGLGLRSAFHELTKIPQGAENKVAPTIYFRKNLDLPYHIDCLFASEGLLDSIEHLEIGKHQDWLALSDHMPLSATFHPAPKTD